MMSFIDSLHGSLLMQYLLNPLQMLHLAAMHTIYFNIRMYIYTVTPFSDSSLEEIAFISSNFSLQLVSEKNNLIKFD